MCTLVIFWFCFFNNIITQALQSLHLDISSTSSPSSSVQTTTTLDCASPTYWTPTTLKDGIKPGAAGGRSGSLRRPHPCSVPVTQSAYKKRVPQRHTSTSSTTQLLYNNAMSPDDTESRSRIAAAVQNGYLETDV